MRRSAVLAACCLFLFPSLALADFYRWTDKDGNEFFTNDEKKIPREYRGVASVVSPDERRVNVTETPAVKERPTAAVAGHKDRYGRGEEYWRRRAASLRLKLRRQQSHYDTVAMQLEEERKKSGNRKKTRSGLERRKIKLEKEISETRRLLEVDLADEARRADAYPGWVRE